MKSSTNADCFAGVLTFTDRPLASIEPLMLWTHPVKVESQKNLKVRHRLLETARGAQSVVLLGWVIIQYYCSQRRVTFPLYMCENIPVEYI